jgi:hypothetical protein
MTLIQKQDGNIATVQPKTILIDGRTPVQVLKENGHLRLASDRHITITLAERR